MYAGKSVFAQLTDLIHPEQFRRCVRHYDGDYKVKPFSCWNEFLCMAFGQLTFRESPRDVEICLRSCPNQLCQLGLRGELSRSVLADANLERDCAFIMIWPNSWSGAPVCSSSLSDFAKSDFI